MNTDIIARLFCAALTLYIPFMAFAIPWSVPAQVRSHEGLMSYPTYIMMILLAVLIMVDVAANKMCTHKLCRIKILADNREYLFIATAFCALVVPFSASKTYMGISGVAGYLYLVIFTGSLALSWCDAFDRRGVNRATYL